MQFFSEKVIEIFDDKDDVLVKTTIVEVNEIS